MTARRDGILSAVEGQLVIKAPKAGVAKLLARRSSLVRSLRLLFPVAVAAVLLAAAVPAQARSLSGWRLAQLVGPADGNGDLSTVAATGRTDAWAAGNDCAPWPDGCSSRLLVEQWNGSKWISRLLPRSLRRRVGPVGVTAVGAASGTDAWVFGQRAGSAATGLHWNGRTWTVSRFPHLTEMTQTAVFSARNAWAFGVRFNVGFTARKIYAVRYNGTKWQRVSLPGEPTSLTALSATDMWAVGISAATFGNPQGIPRYIAMHWNGHGWQTYPLPTLGVQPPAFLQAQASVAAGPKSLWVEYGPDELAVPPTRADATATPP